MSYPIDELFPALAKSLESNNKLVIQAPPGAGKTTRIPLSLLNAPWLGNKKIIMLEPRRIATRSAARFMAKSLGEKIGQTVGYRVRLDNKTGPDTRIEVVTEGVLTRMLQNDPSMEEYGVVIFDEFHERSLNTDFGLALCLDAQEGLREDLKIIVMSATLDGAAVSKLMVNAPILTSEGRTYPVENHYHPIKSNFMRERREFLQEVTGKIIYALRHEQGSVLVFLPGAGEIRQVHSALQDASPGEDIILAPLFGQLSAAEQDAAIQPTAKEKRKVVLATAIAETSLTIEGIRIVIDCGLMRIPRFNPNTGLTQLVTLSVSQASADQRAGRAGRLEPGICFRLWSENKHLLPHTAPEIVDADLAPLVLELAQWGVTEADTLRWLDTPPPPHVAQAKQLLQQLGALDHQDKITAHGRAMTQIGIHPRLSCMILRGKELGAGVLACQVAALLSERDIVRGRHRESNLRERVEAMRERSNSAELDQGALRQVRESSEKWQQQLKIKKDNDPHNLDMVGVILGFAYPDRIAKRRGINDSRYLLSSGSGARLQEHDPLSMEEYIVAAHLDGSRDAKIYLAAAIHQEDLIQYHGSLIKEHAFVSWDDRNECVLARQQQRIGEIVINDRSWQDADTHSIQLALLDAVRSRGLECLPWDETSRKLQARVTFLHQHLGAAWPDFSDNGLLEQIEDWLLPYLDNMSRLTHLKKLDLHSILLSSLSWEQQVALKELAPTHISVPSGSRIPIDYSQDPPVLAVRLQEVFGLSDTPRIANGSIVVVLHLLSPARRPVQITQDLAGFWKSSYFDVKKDLKGRYPKHYWPDNPLQAQATSRTKRKGQ